MYLKILFCCLYCNRMLRSPTNPNFQVGRISLVEQMQSFYVWHLQPRSNTDCPNRCVNFKNEIQNTKLKYIKGFCNFVALENNGCPVQKWATQKRKQFCYARKKNYCPSCLLLYYIIIILLLQENCIHSKQSFEQDSSGAFWLRLEILGSTYYKSPFVCQ